MDRRFKSRNALHKAVHTPTDSSQRFSKAEDSTLAGTSQLPIRASSASQKVSNSEKLRRQAKPSFSSISEKNIPNETLRGKQHSSTKATSESVRRSKRLLADADNPNNTNEDVPSPRKISSEESVDRSLSGRALIESASSPRKASSKENESLLLSSGSKASSILMKTKQIPRVMKKPIEEQLFSQRKRINSSISDSESDPEDGKKTSSPLKIRRIDPTLVSQTRTNSQVPENRAEEFGIPLSGRSKVAIRKTSPRISNSSRLKNIASPIKTVKSHIMEIEEDSLLSATEPMGNKLDDFFKKSGITLALGDGPHSLDDDPPMVEKKMIHLLASDAFKVDDIIDLWKVYISDVDNLKKALNDVTIVNDQQSMTTGINVSLIRIMLHIPRMQVPISDHLLQKLNEAVLIADSIEDVPWAPLLLQQFRFLEDVVDDLSLTTRLEELLETCPMWFQRELILFLPDIVINIQHHAIAETLCKLMETHGDLSGIILECMSNLTLGKEYLEELREKILNMLKNNLDVGRVPSMAKFVLNECPNVEVCEKTLTILRSLDLQPLSGEKTEDYFESQRFFTNGLRMSILLSNNMAQAAKNIVKKTDELPKPLDFIILLLVYSNKTKKKNVEPILKQHIKSGFYRSSLLNSFYQDYKEVARDLQPDALQLASVLLKSDDRAHTDFANEWFRHQFVAQADTIYKQREIIEKIILLMGTNDQTAKAALGVLRRMTENTEEMRYLRMHCNHLRILLEKIDKFDLEEVATLSDLLYALCTSTDSTSEALQDDLFILQQKQLSSSKTLIKCKGVLSAAMAIKYLAGKAESCKIAEDLFGKVRAGVKNCRQSQALFYDQIGRVIADTNDINPVFLKNITDNFQDEFVDRYMTDLNHYRGELLPKFGLNDPESEPQKCVINFGHGKSGAVIPAFFRLLRICFMRLKDGDLVDINVLLGCPVLLPRDMEIPEPWSMDLMICCINWFRELINGFVTQSDRMLQAQVLKRLEHLMDLQAEFSTMLTVCDPRYQPPPCYFHMIPAPPFVKVEKKITKKGKKSPSVDKSEIVPEWEHWKIGSTLCSKNPAYFRRMDAKIVDLLDVKIDPIDPQVPEAPPTKITKAQMCFLVEELLGMFEGGEASESLIRDLIHLLPKICCTLQNVVGELRDHRDEAKNRHVAGLILSLLTTIFNWKAFKGAKYYPLLREGLRTLASQSDRSNLMLRSSKDLVAESYKYFESLSDVATNISLAFAVVEMCRSLMQHSNTFTQQHKNKQANLASSFLAIEWPPDKTSGTLYKRAVVGLISNWLKNEPNPLETVTMVLKWLPDGVKKFEKSQDRLERLPTVTKALFHHMFQRLFEALIDGVKIASSAAKTDPERIKIWQQVGDAVEKIVQLCKSSSRSVLLPFLRSMVSLLKLFLSIGMPIMEQNLRFQTDQVTGIMRMLQGGTRYLNMVCVDSAEKKDITLAKLVPSAKLVTEKLLFLVKGMLVFNNSSEAFWMGTLVNKNLEGQVILSQSSSEPTVTGTDNSDEDAPSEILESDVEDDTSDEDGPS